MSRVDFYEIRGSRWQAAFCDLVARACGAGERVYILAQSEADARTFDDLLWTFREEAFVPHGLWQGETELTEPVAVGWREGNPNRATCLAVAQQQMPLELNSFSRVLEVAPVDLPDLRQAARMRYRAFQTGGHEVVFHASDSSRS